MIEVKVDQLSVSNMGFVVLLRGTGDKRSLPIFIGAAEAQAIAMRLNNLDIPRPMTHDLFKNVLQHLECSLTRIEVCNLVEGTYYAKLVLARGATEVEVDSRPSDAIALALRFSAPIFVAESVMNEAGIVIEDQQKKGEQPAAAPRKTAPHKPLSKGEILKQQLDKAVKEERYEDAAKLRDQINELESKN